MSQSKSRFNATGKLVFEVHVVKMPIGFGRKDALKTKGRLLPNLIHLKRSIVQVKSDNDCLVHALVIVVVKLTNDPNYKSYSNGHKTGPLVH